MTERPVRAALQIEARPTGAYLTGACGGDAALRQRARLCCGRTRPGTSGTPAVVALPIPSARPTTPGPGRQRQTVAMGSTS